MIGAILKKRRNSVNALTSGLEELSPKSSSPISTPGPTSNPEPTLLDRLELSEDPEEATRQYLLFRKYARETFESFLSNLNSDSLRWLEHHFEKHDGELDIATFLNICPTVFPKRRYPEFSHPEEQDFIMQLAGKMLFEDIDVDQSGGADWMEFVEFVCAISECLRMQADKGSGTQFDFNMVDDAHLPRYRPAITKCLFDKLFYWPNHPAENVVVFEEGQSGFHLHRPTTLQRKRRVDGHRSDLLAAAYLPDPFEWTVTTGNDKLLCFWDAGWTMIKKWALKGDRAKNELEVVVGSLCWCNTIKALYFADHRDQYSDKLQAWRIRDLMAVRESEKPFRPDKALEFSTGHTKSVQSIIWMEQMQSIATCSLDKSVRIFDCVQMKRTHKLEGHSKGVTCLEYVPSHQMLLSGGFDNIISMWDPGAGIRFHALHGHECSIIGICAVPNTEHEVLSVDLNSVVKLWDVRRLACIQSFVATDHQAERAGELEPLEPRAICSTHRDRFLVSGRRMVIFERNASQPQLTADSSIMAIVYSERKFEIATAVKNSVRIWCALTGRLLTVHSNLIDGNITAMTLGLGERRCFVGSDSGDINVINFACGAALKSLTSHNNEVTEIQVIPSKVITLSTADRLIRIHDDTCAQKSVVLKSIDVSDAGAVVKFSHDSEKIVVCASEDGVSWYAMDFSKQVANTMKSVVRHETSDGSPAQVSCCKYLRTAPLIVTTDSESCVIFWSVQPLMPFNFNTKVELQLSSASSPSQNNSKQRSSTVAITSMAISWPVEELLVVGTESGNLACINITSIVERARNQRDDILYRKEHGEAADVISGRIFEKLPKPRNTPEFVYTVPNEWLVERAHRGDVKQVIFCKHDPPVVLTMGFDVRVCLWCPRTGDALGTLEQGLAEGLFYERSTQWRFPINAYKQVQLDLAALKKAAAVPEDPDKETSCASSTSGFEGSKAGSRAGSAKSGASRTEKVMARSQSSPGGLSAHAAKDRLPKNYDFRSNAVSRLHQKKPRPEGVDWLAGPLAPAYADYAVPQLPLLRSGLRRPPTSSKESVAVVKAARRLSSALHSLPSTHDLRL